MPRAKAKPKPKGKKGGRRPGSGRKTEAVTIARADLVRATDARLALELPALVGNLLHLAHGGYKRVEQKWMRADQVYELLPRGMPKDASILVEEKVSYADPDRAANVYLMDRLLGKTSEKYEHTVAPIEVNARVTPESFSVDFVAQVVGLLAQHEHSGDGSGDSPAGVSGVEPAALEPAQAVAEASGVSELEGA